VGILGVGRLGITTRTAGAAVYLFPCSPHASEQPRGSALLHEVVDVDVAIPCAGRRAGREGPRERTPVKEQMWGPRSAMRR